MVAPIYFPSLGCGFERQLGPPARTWRCHLTRVAARWLSSSGLGKRSMTVLSALMDRKTRHLHAAADAIPAVDFPAGRQETDAGAEPVALLWIQG
jgi:hypothetical protein